MSKQLVLAEIVKRAMASPITDIGQLTPKEKRQLNAAVKRGHLSKGKGGPFPVLKTVWACPGFNFIASRDRHMEVLRKAREHDQFKK